MKHCEHQIVLSKTEKETKKPKKSKGKKNKETKKNLTSPVYMKEKDEKKSTTRRE